MKWNNYCNYHTNIFNILHIGILKSSFNNEQTQITGKYVKQVQETDQQYL